VSEATSNQPQDQMTELQTKLYQAAKREPRRRFHALYDKLYLSYVLRAAWKQVRQNQGAAGVDQQTLADIEAAGVEAFLAELAQALREKTYRPLPVRRVEISKGEGKVRPLGIPAIRDRVVQAAAKLVLEPIFEADFEGTPSFGFRPGLGQREALEHVRGHSRAGFRWVVEGDIEQFFDTLDHQQLMAAARRRISDGELLRLIYRWLKAGYFQGEVYHDTDQGSPQGGVLSPLLANVYLHAFDQALGSQKEFVGRLTRFADDFVIQCGTQAHAERALQWVQRYLTGKGLRLHPEKTRVVVDTGGFDFLGFHLRRVPLRRQGQRESWGALRWPSRKTGRRFRDRIRELVGPPGRLRSCWGECLQSLQSYLRGWMQYYRHGESRHTFRKLDRYVRERIARNLARSQPKTRKRRRRTWQACLQELLKAGSLPQLEQFPATAFRAYRGRGKARWRAV
jgi:RNA-directed DNA polymerase